MIWKMVVPLAKFIFKGSSSQERINNSISDREIPIGSLQEEGPEAFALRKGDFSHAMSCWAMEWM